LILKLEKETQFQSSLILKQGQQIELLKKELGLQDGKRPMQGLKQQSSSQVNLTGVKAKIELQRLDREI
jgi:hypothetical protein